MTVHVQMTLLFVLLSCASNCLTCDVNDVAVYKMTVTTYWSEDIFPKDYPKYRPKAQWSPVFGQSHNMSYALYHEGEVARHSVRQFAQYGKLEHLIEEGDEEPKVYDQFSANAIGAGVGKTANLVFLDGDHSLVSIISRMMPSPDWFIGVDSLNLCVDSSWVDDVTLDLEPLDAGAASGLTFTAPRWETIPPGIVSRHRPRHPNHPAAGFYYPEVKELPAIARINFNKVKEYSSKDMNNLIRKQIISKLKEKDTKKGWPKYKREYEYLEDDSEEDITTKNNLERLRDLEEDPVGTPKTNLPDNHVVVVTPSHVTTTSTEPEFSNLKNMDDVVLAVARGQRLGLGKHLPRHFRSRLHHAVNRIQPNDCLVSEWSEWTSCSVTCGFGDKFRTRQVIRQKSENGRDCPSLTDREHCGDINSCAHIDYFEW